MLKVGSSKPEKYFLEKVKMIRLIVMCSVFVVQEGLLVLAILDQKFAFFSVIPETSSLRLSVIRIPELTLVNCQVTIYMKFREVQQIFKISFDFDISDRVF